MVCTPRCTHICMRLWHRIKSNVTNSEWDYLKTKNTIFRWVAEFDCVVRLTSNTSYATLFAGLTEWNHSRHLLVFMLSLQRLYCRRCRASREQFVGCMYIDGRKQHLLSPTQNGSRWKNKKRTHSICVINTIQTILVITRTLTGGWVWLMLRI